MEAVIRGSVVIALRAEADFNQVLAGQPKRESSIGCNGFLPEPPLAEFEVRKTKVRGTLKILEARNTAKSFTAKVQIDDPSRDADRYVLVVRWKF